MHSEVREGDSNGIRHAFLQFKSRESAMKAKKDQEEFPLSVRNSKIRMDCKSPRTREGTSRSPQPAFEGRPGSCAILFVGDIHGQATKKDVLEALKPLGNVVSIRMGMLPCISSQVNHVTT